MSQNNMRDVEQMKKHIRKVRTQKISALTLAVIIVISLVIIGVGIYLHQQWRLKTTESISNTSDNMATQISTLAKPAVWVLNSDNVDFREDREVAVQGVSQYQIDILEPADGWINIKGYYDPDDDIWYNDDLLTQVYTDNEPSIDEISHLFAAILSVYYGADVNEAYSTIYGYICSAHETENFSQRLVLGKAGNVYASVGLTNVDGGAAWYMEAGSYN